MKTLLVFGYAVFAVRRLLTYLHFFQQDEYDDRRFLSWLVRRLALDRRATALIVALGLFQAIQLLPVTSAYLITGAIFITLAYFETDPRSSGKKRLVMTSRAKRILAGAILFVAIVSVLTAFLSRFVWFWILAIQFIPFSLVLSNLALAPYEKRVQQRFSREAHSKLERLKPTTIGITGSYGKTSVKHILGHILETQAPTLITPGSVNTEMGIARVVREHLGSHHRFFVCEMGAYGPGSIQRLTCLAPPDLAIITAIGWAHYERFKSLETVAKAKFELAEAAVQRGGKLVVARDVLRQSGPQEFAAEHPREVVAVGRGATSGLHIAEVSQSKDGLQAEVTWRGTSYVLRAPLFGEHHALNIALAFTAACELGVAPDQAIVALASVPQISHRLEIKRQPRGSIVIDDAYNSNPIGFASGLAILDLFRANGGRRILVTPGMVELGEAHDPEHARIGTLAASYVDVLLPVLPERISTLTDAYRAGNPKGTVIPCPTFADAQTWLDSNMTAGDVVLVENDLPDLYEAKLRL